MSGAERTRLYRQRRQAGVIVLPVQVEEGALVDMLITKRWLAPAAADSQENIRKALEAYLADVLDTDAEAFCAVV